MNNENKKTIENIEKDTKMILELINDIKTGKYDNHPRIKESDLLFDIGTNAFSIILNVCKEDTEHLMTWAAAYCDR